MNTGQGSDLLFSSWKIDTVALIVPGTEKVVMEMGIHDGAAPLLWPCSEPEVEGSIVKKSWILASANKTCVYIFWNAALFTLPSFI